MNKGRYANIKIMLRQAKQKQIILAIKGEGQALTARQAQTDIYHYTTFHDRLLYNTKLYTIRFRIKNTQNFNNRLIIERQIRR